MKKLNLVVGVFVISLLAGCAGNREAVQKASVETRQDIFQVVRNTPGVPGKALLEIEFPVKTFRARIVNTYIKHSDPPYTVLVNIDGQSLELAADPVLEDLPGDFRDNPEAGTGWKYNFKKTLLLDPGFHQIMIAVPLSGVAFAKDLNLTTGENKLRITPAYNTSVARHQNYPRFSHGLQGLTTQVDSRIQ